MIRPPETASSPPSWAEVIARRAERRARAGLSAEHEADLVAFARDALGLTIWEGAERILRAIQEHDRVAIRAGRKVSKTAAAAAGVIWWALRGGKVLVTAPTAATLEDPFWLELDRLNTRLGSGIHIPVRPSTPIRTPTGGRIIGRQAAKKENLQGPSGRESLYIIEEASGVRREIVEAIEGNVAGGGKIVMIGNPTMLSGAFYDAFHDPGSQYHRIHLSSRDSPNVIEDRLVIPGLAVPGWIRSVEEEHGPDSPFVAVHVDGNFPSTGANAVVPLALVEAAEARWNPDEPATGRLTIGVDVARSGDDESVVQAVRGQHAHHPTGLRNQTGPSLGAAALDHAERHRHPGETVTINVDVIGVGASVYDWLEMHAPDWAEVHGINVAETAASDRYRLLRDQLAFATRAWLDEGGTLPRHDFLRSDLIAYTYDFDTRGRYRVASKDALKALLKRSPDFGDALSLALYQPEPIFSPAAPIITGG